VTKAYTIWTDERRKFIRRLVNWFRRNGRTVPWRETRDPYAIHVSEIMLQQTQVDRVRDYYASFLRRFPDVRALSRARVVTVERAWQGLGYYARARNLHAAARIIVRQHNSSYPDMFDDLLALPGVGRSTAGAIFSFGFEQPAVILDTNVARVLRRIFLGEFGAGGPMNNALWELAGSLLPGPGRIWDYNQGIMDFGATVCTAHKPDCRHCIMVDACRLTNSETQYNIKSPVRLAAQSGAVYRSKRKG
jgi:A/G-specific adenine glycosylase